MLDHTASQVGSRPANGPPSILVAARTARGRRGTRRTAPHLAQSAGMSGSKGELIERADEFTSSRWPNSGHPANERLEASCDDPRGPGLVHRAGKRSRSGESPHLRGATGQSFCSGVEAHVSGSRQSAWAAGAGRQARTRRPARCPRRDRPAGTDRTGGAAGSNRGYRRNGCSRSNRPGGASRARRPDG